MKARYLFTQLSLSKKVAGWLWKFDTLHNSIPLSDPGGGIFSSRPRVNFMPSFLEWRKNFQLLMVFQVEAPSNFWWNQIFGLLWKIFENWVSKTPSRPDFRAKNAFFHFLSIFCITNHAFSSWIWILHKIIFLLRYITSL